jgi:hypothetical protein
MSRDAKAADDAIKGLDSTFAGHLGKLDAAIDMSRTLTGEQKELERLDLTRSVSETEQAIRDQVQTASEAIDQFRRRAGLGEVFGKSEDLEGFRAIGIEIDRLQTKFKEGAISFAELATGVRQFAEEAGQNAVPGLAELDKTLSENFTTLARLDEATKAARDRLKALDDVTAGTAQTTQEAAKAQKEAERATREHAKAAAELTGAQKRLADAGAILLKTSASEERFDAAAEAIQRQTEATAKLAAEQEKAVEAQQRAAERTQDLLFEPFRNFIRSAQSATADLFEEIFSGGVKSFSDLFEVAKQLVIRFAAEAAALLVFNPRLVLGAAGALAPTAASGAAPSLAGSLASGGSLFGSLNQFGGRLGFAAPAASGIGPPTAGFFGSGATLAGTLGAAGLGAGAGALLAPLLFGGGATTSIGGGLGGALGAGIGFAVGGPLGGLIGGLGGGLFGGGIGSLFGGGGGQSNDVTIGGGLGRAGAGGTGQAAKFVQNFDKQLSALLDSRQLKIADRALRDAASVSVRYSKTLSDNDQARLAAGRIKPVASALGFRNVNTIEQLQEALALEDTIRDLTRDLSPFEKAIEDIREQFEDARAAAKSYGLETEALVKAQREAIKAQREARETAVTAGALAVGEPFRGLADPLRAFATSLRFEGLNPAGQIAAAEKDFRRIARLAQRGDTTAISQLQEAGRLFIEQSERFGASPGGAAARAEVRGVTEAVVKDIEKAQRDAERGIRDEVRRGARDTVDTLKELVEVARDQVDELKKLRRESTAASKR